MIYVIGAYIVAITLVHILLFTRAGYMSKIVLINSAISCLAVAMLLLSVYFKDTTFIDVIFFYIIMSPIGFYGLFIYYKNTANHQSSVSNKNNDNNTKGSRVFETDVVLNKDGIKYNNKFNSKNRFVKKNPDIEKIFSQKLKKDNINKNANNQ